MKTRSRARKKPLSTEAQLEMQAEKRRALNEVLRLRNEVRKIKAKWDAAQTVTGNENHWAQADNLDPHGAASLSVRRTLRSRSRYEIIENNPYLKGTVLTIANDFVGKGGPRLQVTDTRLSAMQKRDIETKWTTWARLCMLRQKLWRMRLAKIVDGESFLRAYTNKNRRREYPITLDFQVLECDRISSTESPSQDSQWNEIDGVRFDNFENPLFYHILDSHPSSANWLHSRLVPFKGQWLPAKYVIHWYRQDRGWLRGIPEAAPSLPLCALLRRYTLAIVRHAEVAADLTALITSEMPPGTTGWTDGNGNIIRDNPFDTFPVEMGMIMNLPYGYDVKQLEAVPLGVQYDEFVGSILREITRPILTPFHIAAGTSKDSNMASAVVDQHIYKGGQEFERSHCEESVVDHILDLWWFEALRQPGYLSSNLGLRDAPPEHVWQWDRVGLDHTDPSKVAQAIQILHDKRLITDRDFQEKYMNRDVDAWREEIEADDEFRKGLEDSGMSVQPKQEERQAKEAEKQLKEKNKTTERVSKDRNKTAEKVSKNRAKQKPAAKKPVKKATKK